MALTSVERKVLESARNSIKSHSESYICYAIQYSRVPGEDPIVVREAKERLRDYVSKKLGDHGTLGSWLVHKRVGERTFFMMDKGLQRHARLAWLAWMLGEKVVIESQIAEQISKYLGKPVRRE
jgi:hypothetical protein